MTPWAVSSSATLRSYVQVLTKAIRTSWSSVEHRLEAGRDVVIVELPPGRADTQRDREFRSLTQFRREIDADWSKRKVEIVPGSRAGSPTLSGRPSKVFRKELGIKLQGTDEKGRRVAAPLHRRLFHPIQVQRLHSFESMTKRDDHTSSALRPRV